MKNYKKDLSDKIIGLYNIYEQYMWRHEEVKLNILIQDNTITFYLYTDKREIDNIMISFTGKENPLYKYISIKILLEMLKDVVVHRDKNEFHNKVLKPYLKIIVNDDSVLKLMTLLVDRQLLEMINDDNDIIQNVKNSIINPMFYPKKVMNKLDERIGMTRKLLKTGVIE